MSGFANPESDLRLWGKQRGLDRPYSLLWHLLDTAAIATGLWELYLSPSQRSLIADGLGVSEPSAGSLVSFWAGLHDIGKITPGFQSLDGGAHAALRDDPQFPPAVGNADGFRHDFASQLAVASLLPRFGYDDDAWQISGCYRVAQLLGGHHGWFQESDTRTARRNASRLGQGGWQVQREAHVEAVFEAVGRPETPSFAGQPPTLGAPVASTLAGLIILADWLASQEWFLKERASHLPADASAQSAKRHLDRTVALVPDVLERAGLGRLRLREGDFTSVFGFAPNPLQRSIVDELTGRLDGPGLLVVNAATGDGKTEAGLAAATALAMASGVDGIHFALPTMATADQMYTRVAAFTAKVASGAAPLTLLHSMSWLNTEYTQRIELGVAEPSPIVSTEYSDAVVTAADWLRGPKRGLLASMSVGTVDQALMAALASKHNSLRMLGLSRKVLVVDEAHAYDAYMQAILRQLLCWLAALGAPAVLLSATLPSTVAGSLAAAYMRGAGRTGTDRIQWSVEYPGWLFVPARPDREPVRISAPAAATVAAHRALTLELDVRAVAWAASDSSCGAQPGAGERMSVVRRVLEPVGSEGGCVAIICNTVREAQQTYEAIGDLRDGGVDMQLLHARFPARVREDKTALIVDALGRRAADAGTRPRAMVVIATQVIEQSLDLDFDLVVSDLCPIAQLLQRAGRCHRHVQKRPRPGWASTPRLVVLDPVNGDGYAKPKAWGAVYSEYLLRATHQLLAERAGQPVRIPTDVQNLVETVYVEGAAGESFLNDAVLDHERLKHLGDELAQRDMATFVVLPGPSDITDLSQLSVKQIQEADAVTRLGADSVRVLCCYVDTQGGRWLDPELSQRLPETGFRADKGFRVDEVRELLARTIPMRSDEVVDEAGLEYARPPRWNDNPWLSKIWLLPHRVTAPGIEPVRLGRRTYLLDDELGLRRVS